MTFRLRHLRLSRGIAARALNDFASVEDAIPDNDESGSDPKEIQEAESSG